LQKEAAAVDLWFLDESGIERNAKPYRIWARIGSNPELSYNTTAHQRENIIAAVRPADGKLVSLIMPTVNTYAFQLFLDELKGRVNSRKMNLLILDNATYHRTAALDWGSLIPWFLPPYSPQLNSIEKFWLNLKQTFFYLLATVKEERFSEAVDQVLNYYVSQPNVCKSICGGQI
jgi:transposase